MLSQMEVQRREYIYNIEYRFLSLSKGIAMYSQIHRSSFLLHTHIMSLVTDRKKRNE